MDKVFQQHQNVVLPFAKRGNLDREYVQPVVEVRAKGPVCNGGFQIAISCRYYADIDFNGLRAADAFEFTFLQLTLATTAYCASTRHRWWKSIW